MASPRRAQRIDVGRALLNEALPAVRQRTLPLVIENPDGTIDTLGSGVPVLVDSDLWILSAAHVVERLDTARRLTVPLSRAGRFQAEVLETWCHPLGESVDVGAIHVSAAAKETIAADKYIPVSLVRALDFSRTKAFDVTSPEQGTGMMAFGGYPGDFAKTNARLLTVDFFGGNTIIAGMGRATPFPHRELDPSLGIIPIWLPIGEREHLGDWSNAKTLNPSLKGLSGSGIWWCFKDPKDDSGIKVVLVSILTGHLDLAPLNDDELFVVTHRVDLFAELLARGKRA